MESGKTLNVLKQYINLIALYSVVCPISVMPVAVAVMTPVLPLILWFGMKMTDRFRSKKADEEVRKDALLGGVDESSINSSINGGNFHPPATIYPS